MNPLDVIRYGHLTVLGSVDNLPEADWEASGVCGVWSTRDIIAHLASYELVLGDVLRSIATQAPAPGLERYLAAGGAFNDDEVGARKDRSVEETIGEYVAAYDAAAAIASEIPAASWGEDGILPWYGKEYDLEDWIVYQFYGHKREHAAQVAVYRDRIGR